MDLTDSVSVPIRVSMPEGVNIWAKLAEKSEPWLITDEPREAGQVTLRRVYDNDLYRVWYSCSQICGRETVIASPVNGRPKFGQDDGDQAANSARWSDVMPKPWLTFARDCRIPGIQGQRHHSPRGPGDLHRPFRPTGRAPQVGFQRQHPRLRSSAAEGRAGPPPAMRRPKAPAGHACLNRTRTGGVSRWPTTVRPRATLMKGPATTCNTTQGNYHCRITGTCRIIATVESQNAANSSGASKFELRSTRTCSSSRCTLGAVCCRDPRGRAPDSSSTTSCRLSLPSSLALSKGSGKARDGYRRHTDTFYG